MSSSLPAQSTLPSDAPSVHVRRPVPQSSASTGSTIEQSDHPKGYRLKRPLDVFLAGLALLFLSPVMLVAALAIKATSRGPVFYFQRRLGFGERPFTILKFRSMRIDADQIGPGFTSAEDPRITSVGRVLRRTSIDELPQLLNVLRGDMSVIGPRPYIGFELETWTVDERAARAAVRPGISGLSQAAGRSSNTVEQSRQFDLRYVDRLSFLLDWHIILQTVWSILVKRVTN